MLLRSAEKLLSDGDQAPSQVGAEIAEWKSRAGPLLGEMNARVPQLLAPIDPEIAEVATVRHRKLLDRHALLLRQLERRLDEISLGDCSDGFKTLRRTILDEADRLEEVFSELENDVDAIKLKKTRFEGRVEISALERKAADTMRGLSLSEQHEIKQLMRRLREFFNRALVDLTAHQEGARPLSARSKFHSSGAWTKISAPGVEGAKPRPKDVTGKSGLFYEAYPNGQLKTLARLKDGTVQRSLLLADGIPEGQYRTVSEVEYYNSEGTLVSVGALYQSDPKPAGVTFYGWAMSRAYEV